MCMVAHSNRKPCCHRYKRAHFLGGLTWVIKSWVARHWTLNIPWPPFTQEHLNLLTHVHSSPSHNFQTLFMLVSLENHDLEGIFWGWALVFTTELSPAFSPPPFSSLLTTAKFPLVGKGDRSFHNHINGISPNSSFLSLFLEKPHVPQPCETSSTSHFPWRPKFNLSNTLKLIKCCFY